MGHQPHRSNPALTASTKSGSLRRECNGVNLECTVCMQIFLIQGPYPEEVFDWIELLNVFWYVYLALKRSPKEESPVLSSKHQPLHIFVPAGFNGAISTISTILSTCILKYFVNIYGIEFLSWVLLLGDRSLLEYTLIFLIKGMLEN